MFEIQYTSLTIFVLTYRPLMWMALHVYKPHLHKTPYYIIVKLVKLIWARLYRPQTLSLTLNNCGGNTSN